LKNFYRSPFSKWPPQYRKNSTLSDIIKITEYIFIDFCRCVRVYIYAIQLINIENRDVCFHFVRYLYCIDGLLTENKNRIHISPRLRFKFNRLF
jgi:hypothetical protein